MLIVLATLFLAYSNGANDNFKGVATLYGSGTTTFKQALTWATLMAVAGSITSVFLAHKLVSNFSGKGLVPDAIIQAPAFTIAVALGAALTIFLATRLGMPVSTTHGLVGALVGAGLVSAGAEVNLFKLGKTFLLPLLVSPILAALLSLLVYLLFSKSRKTLRITKESEVYLKPVPKPGGNFYTASALSVPEPGVQAPGVVSLTEAYKGSLIGINAQALLNAFHFLSAGIVCFARALNDTPKIVGLLLFIQFLDLRIGLLAVGLAMAVGGWLNSRKVAETVSNKITSLNSGQGFTANLVTGILVTTASISGLPVSTTHVSVGALFGIGLVTKQTNSQVISGILFSWILTLPVAAALSGLIYFFISKIM
ncbi:inorganic phosphate transporter [Adhaeribacter aquaticus]|uniref:inorganic phosphate transporter n=1 Tax=Adhaeribacter aquaticus TaxID=299567 RepID=UPI00040ABE83|nr:inorganic phosphate transporter [Adhaeribacter aquaticus]